MVTLLIMCVCCMHACMHRRLHEGGITTFLANIAILDDCTIEICMLIIMQGEVVDVAIGIGQEPPP